MYLHWEYMDARQTAKLFLSMTFLCINYLDPSIGSIREYFLVHFQIKIEFVSFTSAVMTLLDFGVFDLIVDEN